MIHRSWRREKKKLPAAGRAKSAKSCSLGGFHPLLNGLIPSIPVLYCYYSSSSSLSSSANHLQSSFDWRRKKSGRVCCLPVLSVVAAQQQPVAASWLVASFWLNGRPIEVLGIQKTRPTAQYGEGKRRVDADIEGVVELIE